MPHHLVLEIHCRHCHWAAGGDPNQLQRAPWLARFERVAPGTPPPGFDLPHDDLAAVLAAIGRDHPKPFTAQGRTAFPYPHVRPDGGVTWRTVCSQGHDTPIRHERVAATLDAFPPGRGSMRVAF